jgi:cation diffusion facilitator CzcD-associated flavoprotein CzcO
LHEDKVEEFDAIIIGAGVAGLYALYRLREAGLSVRLLEEGSGVGGTWFWNRYPGCRFDTESYVYGYSFSPDLLQEWDWKERYSPQPETERYVNYVADRFDLRKDIQLNQRVENAIFDEEAASWQVTTSTGYRARSQYLVATVGLLSAHYVPPFEGLDSFEGVWCHTGRWPKEGVDLVGKRVGVIGTGATGVQIISEIADKVAHLTVFQRTPNYCVPLRNTPIDSEMQRRLKDDYEEMFQRCAETPSGNPWPPDSRSAYDVPTEERLAQYERLWTMPGFRKWEVNFHDLMTPGPANEEWSEFIREKIRERVTDPVVAEMLVPKDHPFGAKRPPCENGYYEVFNRTNVNLVDLRSEPIERITPSGVRTVAAEYGLDVLILATGYDAVTGALTRIDIRGEGGLSLKEKFSTGPKTYLQLQSAGFPNFFMVSVPALGVYLRAVESVMDWVAELVQYMKAHGLRHVSPTLAAEAAWTRYVQEEGAKSLKDQANAWFIGANIPGKARAHLVPPEKWNQLVMRAKLTEISANGYEGLIMT